MFNKVSNGIMPSGAMFQKDFKKGLQETSLEVGATYGWQQIHGSGWFKGYYIHIYRYICSPPVSNANEGPDPF